MSEPENFLGRWSRRKRGEASEEDIKQDQAALPPEAVAENDPASEGSESDAKDGKAKAAAPEFDLSQLPSIESITASTDIRMFMLPGVPSVLRNAALRKVWVTDPAIRDFIEMAENQWDFTVNSPGFDFSAPSGDVAKMVADILGKKEKENPAEEKTADATPLPAGTEQAENPPPVPEPQTSVRLSEEAPAPAPENISEADSENKGDENIASQNNDATQNFSEQEIPKRRHGSALPG